MYINQNLAVRSFARLFSPVFFSRCAAVGSFETGELLPFRTSLLPSIEWRASLDGAGRLSRTGAVAVARAHGGGPRAEVVVVGVVAVQKQAGAHRPVAFGTVALLPFVAATEDVVGAPIGERMR